MGGEGGKLARCAEMRLHHASQPGSNLAASRSSAPTPLQLSLSRLLVTGEGGVEVEAVGSPDRQRAAFGRSRPASPTRAPRALDTGGGGARAGKHLLPPAAAQAPARPTSSGGSSLLAAALRLQGIGGRSVGLPSRRGGGTAGR